MPTFTNNTVGEEHAIVGVAEKGIGLHGTSNTSTGTGGVSQSGIGVHGVSKVAPGVRGDSENDAGVFGFGKSTPGVRGDSQTGPGVFGKSEKSSGVHGTSSTSTGTGGVSESGIGVHGISKAGPGVRGDAENGTGVFGHSDGSGGIGVHGKGRRLAGFFEGNVEVTGDVQLTNADCAEDFDITELHLAEPGTVMVLGDQGSLYQSNQPYDKRVAGIISGAGGYKPGIVLDKRESQNNRQPVALLGKVYCKVDAQYGAVEVGDLLTTSSTPGHAMKASDPLKAFGAVIGKALRPLQEGLGLVPILIALQ